MTEYTSLQHLQNDLHDGTTSCEETVRHFLQKIEENRHLNAFLETYDSEIIKNAKKLDQKIKNGEKLGRLFGMVIGVKDVIAHKNHRLSAASKMLENFESLFSATAIERLLAEDVLIIGRLNCDEFAMGSTNEYSAFGATLNAYDTTKVAGGSSGASAVAVQAKLCHAALGSDTGGSVRQPASFCNVVGFKPSYGRISRHGLIAYASSFDQIGTLTQNVEDAALLTEIMAGKDDFDATAAQIEVPEFSKNTHFNKKAKIAYFPEAFENEGLDEEIKEKTLLFIEKLKENGHLVEAMAFPELEYIVPAYYVMTAAEASTNLSRYDGIHFGYRSPNATDLESTYTLSRTEGFGDTVKSRIMLGTFVLSSGYYDAYYAQAQKVRRLVSEKTKKIFEDFDFIISPTAPTTAFGLGELPKQDPVTMFLGDIYTVQANFVGVPAISLPLFTHSNGMPFGLQLMADVFREGDLLGFGGELMKNLG